jgi:hypothetical protein
MKCSAAMGSQEVKMSVPGRIGIILIVALAVIDALILASGAKHAATAIETHALIEQTAMRPEPVAIQNSPAKIDPHKTLLSTALHEIKFLMAKTAEKPTKI